MTMEQCRKESTQTLAAGCQRNTLYKQALSKRIKVQKIRCLNGPSNVYLSSKPCKLVILWRQQRSRRQLEQIWPLPSTPPGYVPPQPLNLASVLEEIGKGLKIEKDESLDISVCPRISIHIIPFPRTVEVFTSSLSASPTTVGPAAAPPLTLAAAVSLAKASLTNVPALVFESSLRHMFKGKKNCIICVIME